MHKNALLREISLINRKKQLQFLVLLAVFVSQYDAITFDCVYSMEDWVILDKVYGCTVQKPKYVAGDNTLVSVSKSHLKGKTLKSVETLNIENATMATFPKNIEKSFPSLKGIRIARSGLETVGSDDLKPFPDLKVLCLWANRLTTLDGDLLINNPSLEFINFGSNYIQHVGPNFFSPATKLVAAYFEENPCINNTSQFDIAQLKFEVAVKCPASFEMVELALVNNGKLATKNDDADNKIQLLEARITELEQQLKK